MEIGNITKLTVGAVVAILVIVGFMIPITGGLSHEETVEGINEMNTSGGGHTYGKYRYATSFSATVTGGMKIDDVPISDIWGALGGRFIVTNMGIFSTSAITAFVYYGNAVVQQITDITLSNGTLTYKVNNVAEETTIENVHWAYIPDGDGSFIQTAPSGNPYVNAEAEVIQFNASASTRGVGYGTATDRIVDLYYLNNVSNPGAVTSSFVPIEKGNTTIYGIAASNPSNLIVPEKYTYTQTVGESGPAWEMIAVIPLIAIVALVAMVAGAIWRGRE